MTRRLLPLIALVAGASSLPAPALAESGQLNLHLDLGVGAPFTGPTRPQARDSETAAGGVGWVGLDWQFERPWAIEALLGIGGFAQSLPTSNRDGTRYTSFGVGARWRPLDNRKGYAARNPRGDIWGNLWVSSHAGFHKYDSRQFGFDVAAGYEFSVIKPLQVGVFARSVFALGGDNDGMDAFIVGGISLSIDVMREPAAPDADGDGLSDEKEAELGTNPNHPDTDGDGLLDGLEFNTGTDPLQSDSDADGLNDSLEDADRDGRLDDMETDPRHADTDKGGLPDPDEVRDPRQDPRFAGDDDSDSDGVANPFDECPGTTENRPVDAAGCPHMPEGRFALEGVSFETGSAQIRPESEKTLNEALEMLRRHPNVRVEIAGHTDNVGSAAGNRRLSQKRAEAIRSWMVGKGLSAKRFTVRGYGSSEPVETNETEAGRARNRRIEFRRLDQ